MTKLLNKYKEIKRTKKGFTLVELLVVIAILAVLASVSVVGYLGFTTKARNSNAMTELAQVREVIRAELIDGDTYTYTETTTATQGTTSTDKYTAAYQYSAGSYYFTFTSSDTTTDFEYKDILKASFSDLSALDGTFYVFIGESSYETLTSGTKNTISKIGFVNKDGGYALWTISTDTVATSDKATVVEGNGKSTFKVKAADTTSTDGNGGEGGAD